MISLLKQKEWSPYLAGALLGVVYVISIAVAGMVPGGSGAFENLAGSIAQVFAPTLANNTYFKFVMPPGVNWQLLMVGGIFAGALLSAVASGDFRWRWIPDVQWAQVFGTSRWKRWAVAFVGGVVLEYGAGIAGGCTSGLAISGGLLLAPAAFIFIAGMFMSGIPTALIMYRRKY